MMMFAEVSENSKQINPFSTRTVLYKKGKYSFCRVFWSTII